MNEEDAQMPTYEYQCESCGYCFEKFQSVHDEPVRFCPKCHGKVRKLISSSYGVIFKGSGFYITDYKNKSNTSSTESKGKQKDESTKKGESAKQTKKNTEN